MATEPLRSDARHLRLDPTTGKLRLRQYIVEVVAGPSTGKRVVLTGKLVIGSDPTADLCLPDAAVSRRHVELEPRSEGVRVRDLGSTNGTSIAGMKIEAALLDRPGKVEVGRSTLQISMLDEDDAALPAPVRMNGVVGTSAAMRDVLSMLGRVAPTACDAFVLLGETGTGKDVLARAVHAASSRANERFVIIDCGSLAPTLVESELFGHVKGAFTGAVTDRQGAFLEANGGTLFLDEIGELPLDVQTKLLRFLDAGTVRRLGEDKPRTADVRIIAATHRDLEAQVRAGQFRQDLYFRLAVVVVHVPALRDRLDDVEALALHFVRQMGRSELEVSPTLLARLKAHDWPGNVRELRNVVERALADHEDELLPSVRPAPAVDPTALPFKDAKEKLVDAFTEEYLRALYAKCGGNISKMAREAQINRNYVQHLVAKYGLKAPPS